MNELEFHLRTKMAQMTESAKRSDRLYKTARRQLKSIPLWKRLFFFFRFQPLRKRMDRLKWDRFGYTAAMLSLARDLKRLKRVNKDPVDNGPEVS